ncbi:hypothetical protein F4802DRAFT_170788 [Xylaria palmicola]|nr:hypothetical protein F4802DRAFT_170788 [Xylaria palmicola]
MAPHQDPQDLKTLELAVSDENKYTFPEKEDVLFLLKRLYKDQTPLNCARALDHNLLIRIVIRNSGNAGTSNAQPHAPFKNAITFPTPKDVFNLVWDLIPVFLKDKIALWAADNMEGPIAQEITEYVKQALGLLPIPVPGIFVNAAANLIIPPLVRLIINELAGDKKKGSSANWHPLFAVGYPATGEIHVTLRDLDRDVLRFAGLPAARLPTHLQKAEDTDEDSEVSDYPCLGQPDRRDAMVVTKQFYQADAFNGCKSMQLSQTIAAQIRTNPKSDQDPLAFSTAVWNTLSKGNQTQLKQWAQEDPPNKNEIAQFLYDPVYDLLGNDPYDVPVPIRPSFTSMKVPEVTQWVVSTYG